MSDDAGQPPEQFPEVHDYTILLVYEDGTSDLHAVTAKNSVEAIQVVLHTVNNVRLVHCRRAFA